VFIHLLVVLFSQHLIPQDAPDGFHITTAVVTILADQPTLSHQPDISGINGPPCTRQLRVAVLSELFRVAHPQHGNIP